MALGFIGTGLIAYSAKVHDDDDDDDDDDKWIQPRELSNSVMYIKHNSADTNCEESPFLKC
jgi:hypothetical protein